MPQQITNRGDFRPRLIGKSSLQVVRYVPARFGNDFDAALGCSPKLVVLSVFLELLILAIASIASKMSRKRTR
jgi:hypothetical protein